MENPEKNRVLEYNLLQGDVEIKIQQLEIFDTKTLYYWVAKVWVSKKVNPDNFIKLHSTHANGDFKTFFTKKEAKENAISSFKGEENPYFYRLKVRDYIIIDEDGNLDTIRNKGGEFKRNYVIIPEFKTIFNPTIIEKDFELKDIPESAIYAARKEFVKKIISQSPTNRHNCQQFICDFCHKSKNEIPIKVTKDTDNLNICHDYFYGKFYYKEDEYIVED